jgi:hypothetical protein
MTPNPAIQPSFAPEHRRGLRVTPGRKLGVSTVVAPLRPFGYETTPKVSLKGISLSYKTNDGSRSITSI